MHVVKEPEERKAEFLGAAMRLFLERGYDDTTVNAIIDAVGVSKGAFYHYFNTKEDLLDELAARAGEEAILAVEPVVQDGGLSAIEKLNEMFARTNKLKAKNRELMLTLARVFYSDRNALLRARMTRRTVEMTAPALERIIEQGNAEGTMRVRHPGLTAALVLRFGAEVVSEVARRMPAIDADPAAADEAVHLMEAYSEAVERMLAVPHGALNLVDEAVVSMIRGTDAGGST